MAQQTADDPPLDDATADVEAIGRQQVQNDVVVVAGVERDVVATGFGDGAHDIVHWDSEVKGLGLRVLRSGARSWIVRYRFGPKQRVISLGAILMATTAGISANRRQKE